MQTITKTLDVADFYRGRRFDRDAFVDAFVETFHCVADQNSDLVYRWNGNFYESCDVYSRSARGRAYAVMQDCVRDVDSVPNPTAVVRAIHTELVARGRVKQLTSFSGVVDGRPVAVFRNGFVDLTTGILHPPSTEVFIAGAWNTDYAADMATPRYDRWISERGLTEQRALLESVVGTAFDVTYRHPRVLVLSGTWGAGKSAFTNLLRELGRPYDSPIHLFDWRGALSGGTPREGGRDYQSCIEYARICVNQSTPVIRALHGQKATQRIQKLLAEFPTTTLHIAETLGDGWGVDADEHRRWEASASPDLFDIVRFNERVSEEERYHWHEEFPTLVAELPGIVARFINARIANIS